MKKKTPESFLAQAHKTHGSFYDYSLTNYINSRTSVNIICPFHGAFQQNPKNHIGGQGCGKCAGNSVLTTEDFIKRSSVKHGNLYGYGKSSVKRASELVEIQCHSHGQFFQTASAHLKGHGCPVCGRLNAGLTNRVTTDEFIERSNKIHNGIYDYSQTKVLDSVKKVTITCRTHGNFTIKPSGHLSGHGCRLCGAGNGAKRRTLTTAMYVDRALKVHEYFYSYGKTEYTHTGGKITITCPAHGDFRQTAEQHLAGAGCPKCRNEKLSLDRRQSIEEFTIKANKKHHHFYDYSRANYINNSTNIEIVCPKHGSFYQKPGDHLSGHGCPVCSFSKGELFLLGVFKEQSIRYISQHRLPLYRFSYDFYLPDYNLFIEFHGIQHYKPIAYFGGLDAFLESKKRDLFKRELARGYGISIAYFNHTHLEDLTDVEFKKLILDILGMFKERKSGSWRCVGE